MVGYTAEQLVGDLMSRRTELASRLWKLRRLNLSLSDRAELAASLRHRAGRLTRPRPQILFAEAIALLRASREPIGDVGDSEYYSRCGEADYRCELRALQRTMAIEYYRAWKLLGGVE